MANQSPLALFSKRFDCWFVSFIPMVPGRGRGFTIYATASQPVTLRPGAGRRHPLHTDCCCCHVIWVTAISMIPGGTSQAMLTRYAPRLNVSIAFAMAATALNADAQSFAALIQRFFAAYLPAQRNLSVHTIRAYRHTFRLLLKFLSLRTKLPIDLLSFDNFNPESILAFLDHLERERRNTPRSRNARLAAIRSFARYAVSQPALEQLASCQRVLALPAKRYHRPTLGFMSRPEVAAVIAAIPTGTWSGRRDRLLFTLLYNTGARISEILQLRPIDLSGHAVRLRGNGRKDRAVPIWRQTERHLLQWIRSNATAAEQAVFANYRGDPLSREGVAFRLANIVRSAAGKCPSLAQKRITPHTFRHTSAMHLLQSGVALEVIALWLGHERPTTTHGYVEADLNIKQDCLDRLDQPPTAARRKKASLSNSRLLGFLEAV